MHMRIALVVCYCVSRLAINNTKLISALVYYPWSHLVVRYISRCVSWNMNPLLALGVDDLFAPGQNDANWVPDATILQNQEDAFSLLDGLDPDIESTLLDGGAADCTTQRRHIQKLYKSNQAQKMDKLRARNRLAQARYRQKAKVHSWL
jgi:hypothetical protein